MKIFLNAIEQNKNNNIYLRHIFMRIFPHIRLIGSCKCEEYKNQIICVIFNLKLIAMKFKKVIPKP